jgi:hypothetical protein
MNYTCVHDHLTSAASAAALLPGAVRVTQHLTHVPSDVLPPGSILAHNGIGGWRPDDGSVYAFDSRGGVIGRDAATCPNPRCRYRAV